MPIQTTDIDEQLVEKFETFLGNYCREEVLTLANGYPIDAISLRVSWSDLYNFDHALADDLLDQPDIVLSQANEALRRFPLPVDVDLDGARVEVRDLPPDRVVDVGYLRSEHVNAMIGIRGVVSRQTKVEPRPVELVWECIRCGSIQRIEQPGREVQEPYECEACERQGFNINEQQSTFVDHRLIRIQVPPDRQNGSRDDAMIDVHLEGDLVNEVQTGDRVVIGAILRASQRKDGVVFETYADAVSVTVLETDFEDIEVTREEVEEIERIAADDPYSMLVESFAPNVYGYEHVKEAIVTQLFGGTTKRLPGGGKERGHSHIALIGDPGTTKSTMLKYATDIAPRAVFSSGKTSSAAGLTASAVRDDFGPGNEWTLEGGAIVKADKGLACIDELDKAREEDRSSLHEALEQMTVSVSKAGINATLNARTTLLAAANPISGRFDEHAPIPNQIDLDPALLSRFDLLFTFTDHPDEEMDRRVIQHKTRTWQIGAKLTSGEIDEEEDTEISPPLSQEFVRKYIAHAKRTCRPVPTDEALELVDQEMLKLRLTNVDNAGGREGTVVPVTFRKQEAIHRLAEASARIRLSETVDVVDVRRALRLVKRSLEDVGMDPETETLDADIIESGISSSQRQRRKQFQAVLIDQSRKHEGPGMPLNEFFDIMVKDAGHTRSKIELDIEHFKQRGRVVVDGDNICWYD